VTGFWERFRNRVWGWACRWPKVCPANSHTLIVWKSWRSPWIDTACRMDYARNGTCYCAKLRRPEAGNG
jgi:hypothetical protein